MVHLVSYFSKLQIIAPSKFISENNFIVIAQTHQSSFFTCGNKEIFLPPDSIIISDALHFSTHAEDRIVNLTGFIFRTPNDLHNKGLFEVIGDSDSLRIAEDIFLCRSLNYERTKNIEELFIQLLCSLNLVGDQYKNTENLYNKLILVKKYIHLHYSETITLLDLAEVAGCNPVYLSNSFSKAFSVSPMQFLKYYRIEKSKKYLLNSKLTVKEIAKKVGYQTQSQFGAIFKKHTGLTPNEFKTKVRYQSNLSSNDKSHYK